MRAPHAPWKRGVWGSHTWERIYGLVVQGDQLSISSIFAVAHTVKNIEYFGY
jgi:hypothetical protein